jgi:hypothetical protein
MLSGPGELLVNSGCPDQLCLEGRGKYLSLLKLNLRLYSISNFYCKTETVFYRAMLLLNIALPSRLADRLFVGQIYHTLKNIFELSLAFLIVAVLAMKLNKLCKQSIYDFIYPCKSQ